MTLKDAKDPIIQAYVRTYICSYRLTNSDLSMLTTNRLQRSQIFAPHAYANISWPTATKFRKVTTVEEWRHLQNPGRPRLQGGVDPDLDSFGIPIVCSYRTTKNDQTRHGNPTRK